MFHLRSLPLKIPESAEERRVFGTGEPVRPLQTILGALGEVPSVVQFAIPNF